MSAQPDPNRFYRPRSPHFQPTHKRIKPTENTYQTFICAYNSKNADDDDGEIHYIWKLIKTQQRAGYNRTFVRFLLPDT